MFLWSRVVSNSPKPQAGGPPLVSCLQLLIQYICSCPPYWRPFLRMQPEDALCHGDRDPPIMATNSLFVTDMYMSYRWVSFWWKVTWQRNTEWRQSVRRPCDIKSLRVTTQRDNTMRIRRRVCRNTIMLVRSRVIRNMITESQYCITWH